MGTPTAKRQEEEVNPFQDVQLAHSGRKIILPSDPREMEIPEAIDALQSIEEDLEAMSAVYHEVDCFPLDGLVAFNRACVEHFGIAISSPGAWGEPPTMMTVPIGVNAKVQVPWGCLKFPQMKNSKLQTIVPGKGNNKPKFIIGGEVKKKYDKQVQAIAAKTEKYLKEKSIYKGKAIKVNFGWLREGRDFHPMNDAPTFMDASNIGKASLILPYEVMSLLQTGLFAPIEKSALCRKFGIPLKRGILLMGPYGCGKTLTAYATARICEDNGWTFMYVSDVRDLPIALRYAKLYGPCVIFSEDVDIATNGPRNAELNELLNIIDGADYKDCEIITILTTNHAENINQAFLRPGRIDTVIPILPPDRDATERLIRHYGGKLLAEGTDLSGAADFLAGQIPATIRECVERSKISTLSRTDDLVGKVTSSDLIAAMKGMKPHMDLLQGAKPGDGPSMMEVGLASLGLGLAKGMSKAVATPDALANALSTKLITEAVIKFIMNATVSGSGAHLAAAEAAKSLNIFVDKELSPKKDVKETKQAVNSAS